MSNITDSAYMSFNSMVTTVTSSLSTIAGACERLDMAERAAILKGIKERMDNHLFSVGILGEFKRGKSTVINALLGAEIVPADVLPASATLNYIRWDATPHAKVNFKDGTSKEVPIDEMSHYVTKLTEEDERMAATVEDAVVHYPCLFCQYGVQIVDTPGLNDDERMSLITENVLPHLDAIIMVISADSPFSESEADFVRNKIMASDLGRVIFVINKIDVIRRKDREKLVNLIRGRIAEKVMEKMGRLYGVDSPEYQAAQMKVGELRVFPISARDALDAKLDGDEEALAASGLPALEDELSHLLTDLRGMLELVAPVNQVRSCAQEAIRTIDVRTAAMHMDAQEFERVQTAAIREIEATRKKKQQDLVRLNETSAGLYEQMQDQVDAAYQAIQESVAGAVDQYVTSNEATLAEMETEAMQQSLATVMQSELEAAISRETEGMVLKVKERVGESLVELKHSMDEITASWERAKADISSGSSGAGSLIGSTLFDVGSTFMLPLPYVGGIVAGWKEGGAPGALLGGAAGALAGYAAGALLSTIALPLVPVLIGGSLVASFTGKKVVSLAFPQKRMEKKIQKLREFAQSGVVEMINSLRRERYLENWLKGFCQTIYQQISEQMNKDMETLLVEMEGTISHIKAEITRNAAENENTARELDQLKESISGASSRLEPISRKLETVLRGDGAAQ